MPEATFEVVTLPLVGRAAELDRIAVLRGSATVPGVVIRAPAGVGKSRLAREAVAGAERDGALVGWVQATRSAATVPLAAFAGLLPPDTRSDDLLALMRQSAASLRSRANGRAVVLGVDDAQLLDPTSAALTLQLAETHTAFLVVTVRTGEPCPDAVESLWKDAGAVRLDLPPLDESETTSLVEGALGAPVEQRAAHWMFEHSQGNALYARELLIGAVASGSLSRVRGFWRMTRRPAVAGSLVELIARRLAQLDAGQRDAIELLAYGEPLRLDLALGLAGESALAEVEAQRLVVVEGTAAASAVRLAHPLYGEAVRATLPLARARDLRRRLAESVQARGELAPDDALRVARWLLDAGEPIALPVLAEAGSAALRTGDLELAAQLATLARAAGAGAPAALLLARAHVARKRFADAEAVLESAQPEIEDPDLALEYLELCVDVLYWAQRRDDELDDLLWRARTWWPDEGWRQRLFPLEIYVATLGHPYGATLDLEEEMLANPDLAPEVRRRVENLHGASLYYVGRVLEAAELTTRRRPPVPLVRANDDYALLIWGMVVAESGCATAGLEAELGELMRRAAQADDPAATGVLALAIANLRVAAAQYVAAARWLDEAELQFERHDVYGILCITRALQVEVAVARGRNDEAAAALGRCLDVLGGHPPLHDQAYYVARAHGWARYGAGDAPAAQEILLEASHIAAPMPLLGAQLAYEAMRAGAPASAALRELAGPAARCDAPLTVACAAHVEARARRDAKAVLDASNALEAIGYVGFALEAAAHAAELFADAGREDSARRAVARARALLERTEGRIAPFVAGLEAVHVELTTRERQLVELAREGLTNAEIADRLVLSVRTVESHIYRAMHKLGVSDRREL